MKKVYFCTLGCRVNQYESVSLAESLIERGYTVTKALSDADLVVVNTCAVTAESARKSAQAVRRAARAVARVAVLGCASQLDADNFVNIDGVVFVGGCGSKHGLIDFIDGKADNACTVGDVSTDYESLLCVGNRELDLFSSCRAYVKIQDGCNCRCSYCTIPFARGVSRSRELVDIISEIKRLASLGYREVELTGIETGAYNKAPLSELIKRTAEIDGIERIRLGSLSPNCITDSFVETVRQTTKFMPHLHISVQSGSPEVLKAMHRPYSGDTLYAKLDIIKDKLPEYNVSVDIITGFPGETDNDFNKTLDMVKRYRFSHVHGFPYSERAGTLAATMDGSIPVAIRKQRNEALLYLGAEIHRGILDAMCGKTDEVLIERISGGLCRGHTKGYLECSFANTDHCHVGDFVSVKINGNDGEMLTAVGKDKR